MPRAPRRVSGLAFGSYRKPVQMGNVWYFEASASAVKLGEYQASDWEDSSEGCDNGLMLDEPKERTVGGPRGLVKEWSRHSRNYMIYRLATLDYRPLFDGDRLPVLLTLTLPRRWLAIAPDAQSLGKRFRAFLARYERAWGGRLICVWKREFQRRGAPHYHLLMLPPAGRARGSGMRFSEWVGPAWAQVCLPAGYDARDDEQLAAYREHALDGTGTENPDFHAAWVDEAMRDYGLHERIGAHVSEYNFVDPARIAAYFSKHGAFASKGYQNEVPEAWEGTGSVGRYWGYTAGLEVTSVRVEVQADDPADGDDPDDTPPSPGGGSPRPKPPVAPSSSTDTVTASPVAAPKGTNTQVGTGNNPTYRISKTPHQVASNPSPAAVIQSKEESYSPT